MPDPSVSAQALVPPREKDFHEGASGRRPTSRYAKKGEGNGLQEAYSQ